MTLLEKEIQELVTSLSAYVFGEGVTIKYKVVSTGPQQFPMSVSGSFVLDQSKATFNIFLRQYLPSDSDSEFCFDTRKEFEVFCASVTNKWRKTYFHKEGNWAQL